MSKGKQKGKSTYIDLEDSPPVKMRDGYELGLTTAGPYLTVPPEKGGGCFFFNIEQSASLRERAMVSLLVDLYHGVAKAQSINKLPE